MMVAVGDKERDRAIVDEIGSRKSRWGGPWEYWSDMVTCPWGNLYLLQQQHRDLRDPYSPQARGEISWQVLVGDYCTSSDRADESPKQKYEPPSSDDQNGSTLRAQAEATIGCSFEATLDHTLADYDNICWCSHSEREAEELVDIDQPSPPINPMENEVESPAPEWLKNGYDYLMTTLCKQTGFTFHNKSNGFDVNKVAAHSIDTFRKIAYKRLHDRKTCITTDGYIGLVPAASRGGDFICVLYGASTLFVLRPVTSPNGSQSFVLLGEAYVHGMMNGNALSEAANLGYREESFSLV
jgi:hypothetical protein